MQHRGNAWAIASTVLARLPFPSATLAVVTDLGLIAAAWCLGIVFVNAFGDFPLDDDWAYGTTVKQLLAEGTYHPVEWAMPPFLSNMLWGMLFSIPGKFSYTVLRISTLCASFAGLAGVYVLLRDLKQTRIVCVIAALTVGFNPIYYALSHTFMTDVLFTVLLVWSAVFLIRSLRSNSISQMLLGCAFAVAATLSRQLGLCVPVAFFLLHLCSSRITWRATSYAAAPLVLAAGAFLALKWWLTASGRTQMVLDGKTLDILRELTDLKLLTSVSLANLFVILTYLGLFLLPILLLALRSTPPSYDTSTLAFIAISVLIVAVGAIYHTQPQNNLLGTSLLMPLTGNILVPSGIGPLTLRDTFVLKLENVRPLPATFWAVTTAVALMGVLFQIVCLGLRARVLATSLTRVAPKDPTARGGAFLLLTGAIYLLTLLPVAICFDRYFLPLIPFLGAGILATTPYATGTRPDSTARWQMICAGLTLACLAAFAVCGTHDYLAWNRARWASLSDLMVADGVSPKEIDGGFEFNGLYLFDPHFDTTKAFVENIRTPDSHSWWWVRNDTYLVSFGPVPGYSLVREYDFPNWLPPRQGRIVLQRRLR
jgi:4-amino-4-deoxy-L-arabinose transferase-like glycosyltransferase